MSDIKRSCPGSNSWTSSVGIAFRDGEPCPYCGLPAEAVALLDAAAERGLERAVVDRLAAAERDLAGVRAENRRLLAALQSIEFAVTDAVAATEATRDRSTA